jgi:hypothetical protein
MIIRTQGKAGLTICLIIAFIAGCLWLSSAYIDGRMARPMPQRSHEAPSAPARDMQFEQSLKEAIASGAIHSVDVEAGRVRIPPLIWCGQSIEQKQQSLLVFSSYFKSCGKSGRVEILSDRNDTVLARYSSWAGCQIEQ